MVKTVVVGRSYSTFRLGIINSVALKEFDVKCNDGGYGFHHRVSALKVLCFTVCRTALHYASANGHLSCVVSLLAAGSPVKATDQRNCTKGIND